MKKSQRQKNAELVMSILDGNKYGYEVLNRNKAKVPNHVRVKGWGDIWPTTFTFMRNGKWSRNNAEALFDALSDSSPTDERESSDGYSEALAKLNSLVPILGLDKNLERFCKAQLEKAGYEVRKMSKDEIRAKEVQKKAIDHEQWRKKENEKRKKKGLPEIPCQLKKDK